MEELRQEALMKLLKKEPHSISDVAQATTVHYVTAQKWIKELAEKGMVEKLPFPRGKETLWVARAGNSSDGAGLRVQFQGKVHPVTSFVSIPAAEENNMIAAISSSLAYLYRRSYFADDPENQHKRGGYTPVEIREILRKVRGMVLEELKLVEQILLMDELFVEGSAAYQLMGDYPDMSSMNDHAALIDNKFRRERLSNGDQQ